FRHLHPVDQFLGGGWEGEKMSKDPPGAFGEELLNFLLIREEGLGNGDSLTRTEDLFGVASGRSADIPGISDVSAPWGVIVARDELQSRVIDDGRFAPDSHLVEQLLNQDGLAGTGISH